jgi:predicted HicB family RNase H-like nuclease
VLDLNDIITFSGNSVQDLKQSFKDSVDAYIEYCEENGEEPEKPFSGKFSVRIDPELHKAISRHASLTGKSINTIVSEAISDAIYTKTQPTSILNTTSNWVKILTNIQIQDQTLVFQDIQERIPYYTAKSEAIEQ